MVKLRKDEVADIDVNALDEAEYSDEEFEAYEGEIPPSDTELTGYISKLWWCRTAEKDDGTGLDPMIKVLWIAADNEGDTEDYNGLPIWENAVLIPSAKFRWAPFLNTFGITLKAIKTATYVGEEDDERVGGAPIEKIGSFTPGEDSDDAWSRVITKRRFWNDEWRVEAKKWLPYADGESPEEEEEPEDVEDTEEVEDEEEYEGEEEAEEEEEEEEPEPARPARGRKPATAASKPARPAPARAARPAAAKPATASTSRRGAKPAAAAKAAPARGRGRKPAQDDPPF